jgi:predicted transcriptional regulator YdeE
MQSYSHGEFQVSGYKISTTNTDFQSRKDIGAAWTKFRTENMADKIKGKTNPTLHCVYYNYTNAKDVNNRGYDMLIGFVTEKGAQTDPEITTIVIPAQNYKYETVKGIMPITVIDKWREINKNAKIGKIQRTYGFDMDMYLEDGSVTVTVAVEGKPEKEEK